MKSICNFFENWFALAATFWAHRKAKRYKCSPSTRPCWSNTRNPVFSHIRVSEANCIHFWKKRSCPKISCDGTQKELARSWGYVWQTTAVRSRSRYATVRWKHFCKGVARTWGDVYQLFLILGIILCFFIFLFFSPLTSLRTSRLVHEWKKIGTGLFVSHF